MTGPSETPLFTLDGGLFDDVSTLAVAEYAAAGGEL